MAPGASGLFFNSNMPGSSVTGSSVTHNNDRKINKWITGNRRGIEELVKKYNAAPTNDIKTFDQWKTNKVKIPIKTDTEPPVGAELVDDRYIKAYTADYSSMMTEIENICKKHPTLATRYRLESACLAT